MKKQIVNYTYSGRKINPGDYIVYFKDGIQVWDQEDFEKLLDGEK